MNDIRFQTNKSQQHAKVIRKTKKYENEWSYKTKNILRKIEKKEEKKEESRMKINKEVRPSIRQKIRIISGRPSSCLLLQSWKKKI